MHQLNYPLVTNLHGYIGEFVGVLKSISQGTTLRRTALRVRVM
jgi:hypothetical protein